MNHGSGSLVILKVSGKTHDLKGFNKGIYQIS